MVALPRSAVTNIPTFDGAVNGDPDPPPTLSKDGTRTAGHSLLPGALTFLDDRIPIDAKAFLNEEEVAVLVSRRSCSESVCNA